MLGLSELSHLVWNELLLPNNIKKDWVSVTNNRFNVNVSQHPFIGADILNLNDSRLNNLIDSLRPFKFSWVRDAEAYLKQWKRENDELIAKLPR
jgi:hypothetical protein